MAEQHANDQERRIHELDQNVVRFFEIRKRLGKGAYGIVWKATDKRKKDTVALKKIYDAFRDETDAQRTYREVIFLRAFRHHPNIIRILDIFKAANNLDFYLVFEYMDSDLHNVIKKGDVLKDIHKRFVMYQLINAIKYMHSGNVIHRDLKPSNILIDSKCRLKVADFGLARTLCPKRRNAEYCKDEVENEALLTDYVATRWYRAPEILVASRKYTKGIDMWSLGCILGEMIRQKPLFQGTSTINQIEKIVSALPEVTEHDIESIGAGFGSVLLSKKIVRDRRHSLDELLRNSCDDSIALVKSLLVLDPDGRLTAKEAIAHPYVHRFRTASANMELRTDIRPPLDDDVRYSVNDYRATLYEMISPEVRDTARNNSATQTTPNSTGDDQGENTLRTLKTVTKTSRRQIKSSLHAGAANNVTKAWVDDHRRHQPHVAHTHSHSQPQPQHHHQQPQQQHQSLQQNRVKRIQHNLYNQNQMSRNNTNFSVTGNHVTLRRELAAVTATAPHCAGGSLWQQPVAAQIQPQPQSQPQQQAQTQSLQAARMWTEPVPVPGPLPMPVPAPEPERMSAGVVQLRARGRKVRKDVKRQPKPKDEPQVRPLAQIHAIVQSQTQAHVHTQNQLRARIKRQAQLEAQAHLQAQVRAELESRIKEQEAKFQFQQQAQAQAQAEAKAQAQAQAQAEAETQAQAEAQAQAQAKSKAQAHAQTQVETQAQAQTQVKAQVQAHAKGQVPSQALTEARLQAETQQTQVKVTLEQLKLQHQELSRKNIRAPQPMEQHALTEAGLQAETQQTQEKIDLKVTLEQLKLQHEELKRKNIRVPQPMEQQISSKALLPGSGEEDVYYTPEDTMRKHSQDAIMRMNSASAAFICYKSRLNKLEEEMDKCKRQLCHYVQDNKELLNKQRLRHHIEQLLQPPAVTLPSDPLPVLDPNLILNRLELERESQRRLQLREFLARDEQNANTFELPNLCDVYKVSSSHALAQSQGTFEPQCPMDRPESLSPPASAENDPATQSTSFESMAQVSPQNTAQDMPFDWSVFDTSQIYKQNRPQVSYAENVRIQEAEFYKDFDINKFKSESFGLFTRK